MKIHQKVAAVLCPLLLVTWLAVAFVDNPWRLLWYPAVVVAAVGYLYCQWQFMNLFDAWRERRKES